MNDRDYCYPPDFVVLRNKLNLRDFPTLEAAERLFVAQRLLEAVPSPRQLRDLLIKQGRFGPIFVIDKLKNFSQIRLNSQIT